MEKENLAKGQKFCMKRPPKDKFPVAIIEFVSTRTDGSIYVSYRRMGTRVSHFVSAENFLKRWLSSDEWSEKKRAAADSGEL